ncbi:phosphotransferase enzyme family protein [Alicyclobacillus suci]|uniref:phosphotransferase enzyme family protein n=1 Tax=Alicyclobacillus suci TaxID=2816080 RepID=UPI001A8F6803|nr:phosphotransferase [Alicyclobacillus suci]
MQDYELDFIVHAYSWPEMDTTVQPLQYGENNTYVVNTPGGKYVTRRYRQGRYSVHEIRAELEWMERLGKYIAIPRVIRNRYRDSVSRLVMPNEEFFYATFEFIEGDIIEHPISLDYYNLGRLMRNIHSSADLLVSEFTTEWQAWNRPVYDLQCTVEMPLRNLLKFSVLTEADRNRCVNIAKELRSSFDFLRPIQQFIHADIHFGNILVAPDKWYCLDFDECGFGHRAMDIGVIRLHLKNNEESQDYWGHFLDGYGGGFSREEISLGTALRIFYMAGKIPLRQDIEHLRQRPDERIRKYLRWIESEIFD